LAAIDFGVNPNVFFDPKGELVPALTDSNKKDASIFLGLEFDIAGLYSADGEIIPSKADVVHKAYYRWVNYSIVKRYKGNYARFIRNGGIKVDEMPTQEDLTAIGKYYKEPVVTGGLLVTKGEKKIRGKFRVPIGSKGASGSPGPKKAPGKQGGGTGPSKKDHASWPGGKPPRFQEQEKNEVPGECSSGAGPSGSIDFNEMLVKPVGNYAPIDQSTGMYCTVIPGAKFPFLGNTVVTIDGERHRVSHVSRDQVDKVEEAETRIQLQELLKKQAHPNVKAYPNSGKKSIKDKKIDDLENVNVAFMFDFYMVSCASPDKINPRMIAPAYDGDIEHSNKNKLKNMVEDLFAITGSIVTPEFIRRLNIRYLIYIKSAGFTADDAYMEVKIYVENLLHLCFSDAGKHFMFKRFMEKSTDEKYYYNMSPQVVCGRVFVRHNVFANIMVTGMAKFDGSDNIFRRAFLHFCFAINAAHFTHGTTIDDMFSSFTMSNKTMQFNVPLDRGMTYDGEGTYSDSILEDVCGRIGAFSTDPLGDDAVKFIASLNAWCTNHGTGPHVNFLSCVVMLQKASVSALSHQLSSGKDIGVPFKTAGDYFDAYVKEFRT